MFGGLLARIGPVEANLLLGFGLFVFLPAAGAAFAGAPVECAAEIDRFQAIVASDHETGNVAPDVYDKIEADLSRASMACASGHAGQAHAIVTASKARHGYRT